MSIPDRIKQAVKESGYNEDIGNVLAISMTMLGGAPASGVIILGKDIKTGLPPILDYGVPGRGIGGSGRSS